jgi:hypothetical protein
MRQINYYGFKKIPSGPFLDYYYHKSFTRTGVKTMRPKASPRKSPKPKKDRLSRSPSDDTHDAAMIKPSFSPIEIYNDENTQESFCSSNKIAPYSQPVSPSFVYDDEKITQDSYCVSNSSPFPSSRSPLMCLTNQTGFSLHSSNDIAAKLSLVSDRTWADISIFKEVVFDE